MKLSRKRKLILLILSILIGLFLIVFLQKNNLLLFSILLAILLISKKFWLKNDDIYFFFVGALAGSFGEIICVNFNVWKYTNPTFFGVPIWLPLAWGLASVVVKKIVEILFEWELVSSKIQNNEEEFILEVINFLLGLMIKYTMKYFIRFVVCITILILIYQLEAWEVSIRKNFEKIIPIILAFHFIFLSAGLMVIGFPIAYIVRHLYNKVCSALPKKILYWIEESRKSFPLYHKFLDSIIWLVILPFIFGSVIFFIILPGIGIKIPFEYLFMYYQLFGVIYFSLL